MFLMRLGQHERVEGGRSVYEGGRAVDPKSILYRCAIAAQVAKPKYKFLGKKFYDDTEHALPHFAVGLAKLRI